MPNKKPRKVKVRKIKKIHGDKDGKSWEEQLKALKDKLNKEKK